MTMPTLIVEIGFTVGASTGTALHLDDLARGKVGTGTVGTDSTWTDVTADVLSVSVDVGVGRADQPALRYEAGKCVIVLDDPSRYYDPSNLSGPYVSGGVTQVTPMRAVRVRAVLAGVYYDVWRGYADSWDYQYVSSLQTTCTLTATDGLKVLAAYDRVAVAAVGGSEDTGARIGRVLDSAGWSATDRILSTGDSTHQSTTLTGNALAEIQAAAESELGEFYIDSAGRAFFRNRLAILTDTRSNTSQATFSDTGAGGLPYRSVTTSYDSDQLVNVVHATRNGGTLQTSTLDTSQSVSAYLTHTLDRSDLTLETDAAALDWANLVVYQNQNPELRFESLTVGRNHVSATETSVFTQVLARVIGDRVTISHTPVGGGSAISRDCFVRGARHRITPDSWDCTWALQSATKFQFLTLDHATLGVLGSNALA